MHSNKPISKNDFLTIDQSDSHNTVFYILDIFLFYPLGHKYTYLILGNLIF